ncbi:Flocculation suppression protein [Rhodotorula sphaerocarpa]
MPGGSQRVESGEVRGDQQRNSRTAVSPTGDLPSPADSGSDARIPLELRETEEDERDELDDEPEGVDRTGARSRRVDLDPAPSPQQATSDAGPSATPLPPPTGKAQASFVHKVWAMLEDPSLRDYIAWSEDGRSFLVYDPADFARDVLPRFFKHSNFSSFLRQCNFYNWSKVNDALSSTNSLTQADGSQGHAWEFRNSYFQRGRPDLLAKIKRKTAKGNSTSVPAAPVRSRTSVSSGASIRPPRPETAGSEEQATGPEEDALSRGNTSDGSVRQPSLPSRKPSEAKGPDGDDAYGTRASLGDASSRSRAAMYTEKPSAPEGRAVSPRHPERQPLQQDPPPAAQYYLQPAPPRSSPGTRPYPLPTSASFPSQRHAFAEEPIIRSFNALENQVRMLGDVLQQDQRAHAQTRATSSAVLQTLIGALAGLDKEGRFHAESYGGIYGPPPGVSWATSQFYYNRVPAAESYTRTARPESPSRLVPHGDVRPVSSGSQVTTAAVARSPTTSDALRSTSKRLEADLPRGDARGFGPHREPFVLQPDLHPSSLAPLGKRDLDDRAAERASGSGGAEQLAPLPSKGCSLPPLSSLLNPVDPPAPPEWTKGHVAAEREAAERRSPKRMRH